MRLPRREGEQHAAARVHCWLDDLVTGRVASMEQIAVREGVGKRYVSRLVRLGLLAPGSSSS